MDEMFLTGRPVRITMESQDGRVLSCQAVMSRMNVSSNLHPYHVFGDDMAERYIYDGMEWDIELRGVGGLPQPVDKFIIDTKKKATALEWKCDYCASVHPRKEIKCHECGASRSFVYG